MPAPSIFTPSLGKTLTPFMSDMAAFQNGPWKNESVRQEVHFHFTPPQTLPSSPRCSSAEAPEVLLQEVYTHDTNEHLHPVEYIQVARSLPSDRTDVAPSVGGFLPASSEPPQKSQTCRTTHNAACLEMEQYTRIFRTRRYANCEGADSGERFPRYLSLSCRALCGGRKTLSWTSTVDWL